MSQERTKKSHSSLNTSKSKVKEVKTSRSLKVRALTEGTEARVSTSKGGEDGELLLGRRGERVDSGAVRARDQRAEVDPIGRRLGGAEICGDRGGDRLEIGGGARQRVS